MTGPLPKYENSHLLFDDTDLFDEPIGVGRKENDGLGFSQFGDRFLQQFEERGPEGKLTQEERQAIEQEIAERGVDALCRCTQADFNDGDLKVRHNKAVMVNLYFEYGGNWNKVFRDSRSVTRRTFAVYWRDELLRSYVEALDPILMLEARGVVVEVWKDGIDEKARLAAALQYLQAYDAKRWDKGVRKQIVANKGSLQSSLFNRVIDDNEYISAFVKDRLNKLPEAARTVLEQSLEAPRSEGMQSLAPVSQAIQSADMTKLKDPFGDSNDE